MGKILIDLSKYFKIELSFCVMFQYEADLLVYDDFKLASTYKIIKTRYKYHTFLSGAIVAKIVRMPVNSEGYIISQLSHNHSFQISVTSPFKW